MRAFDLVVYAHLLIGGLAVGAMGWRLGWPAAASVLAAVVFMLGGPASGRLQHTGIILSYALLPPALLLMSLALERRSLWLGASFGVVAAMLLLGRNQEALLLSFVLLAVLVGEFAARTGPLALAARAQGHDCGDGAGRRRGGGGAAAADAAVRRPFQPPRGAARQGAGGVPLSGQSGLLGGRQRHGLAGDDRESIGGPTSTLFPRWAPPTGP